VRGPETVWLLRDRARESMAEELAVLQVGEFSSFVGAHFWNFQNELYGNTAGSDLLPTVLYNETSSGSYRPRVQVIDAKGSLGSRPMHSALRKAQDRSNTKAWSESLEVYEQDPISLNPYLESLDAESAEAASSGEKGDQETPGFDGKCVRYWTDYCKELFCDRSLNMLNGTYYNGDSLKFFNEGHAILSSEALDELEDGFRWMAEQSDHMTGIVALCESDTGFAGVAEKYLSLVHDSYPSLPIFVHGCAPRRDDDTANARIINEAWLAALSLEIDAHFVPASGASWKKNSFPHLRIPDTTTHYLSSSLQAVGLEMATLPARMRGGMTLSSLVYALRPRHSMRLSSCELQFPALKRQPDWLREPFQALTPSLSTISSEARIASAVITRGLGTNLHEQLQEQQMNAPSLAIGSQSMLPIPIPFPQFFDAVVDKDGDFLSVDEARVRAENNGKITGYDCNTCAVALKFRTDMVGCREAARHWSRELRLASKWLSKSSSAIADHAYILEISETLNDVANDYTD